MRFMIMGLASTDDDPTVMPAPEAFLGRGDEAADHEAEHGAEDSQGQPGAGLAVGRLGEGAAGLEGQMRQGRIAMEHLDDEPEDDMVKGLRRASRRQRCPNCLQSSPTGAARLTANLL